MITRLMLVAWDFEGSDRAARLPQYQRHILNRRTTISDSSFVMIITTQAIAQGTRQLLSGRAQRGVLSQSWEVVAAWTCLLVLHNTLSLSLVLQCWKRASLNKNSFCY